MKTEARFLIAVMLMLIVLVGTNRLFPPVVPEGADLLGDSVAAEVEGLADETGDVAAVPSAQSTLPETGAPVPDPVAGATDPVEASGQLPVVDVVVESPLYRFTFSSLGAPTSWYFAWSLRWVVRPMLNHVLPSNREVRSRGTPSR